MIIVSCKVLSTGKSMIKDDMAGQSTLDCLEFTWIPQDPDKIHVRQYFLLIIP